MRDEPEKKREPDAQEKTGGHGEIKSSVLTAMDDVAGKMSKAEWKFSTKEEESANKQEKNAKEDQHSAEFT
jgi:hypothetical protein